MLNHVSHLFQQRWNRTAQVLNWPACSADLSSTENIQPLMKWKIQQRLRTVEQRESNISQKWDNIPVPQVQWLLSSVPRCLRAVVKRWGDVTQWKTWPCANFFKLRCCHQIQNNLHFQDLQGFRIWCFQCSCVNVEEVYISQHSVFIKILHNILHKTVFLVQLNINNKPMSTF